MAMPAANFVLPNGQVVGKEEYLANNSTATARGCFDVDTLEDITNSCTIGGAIQLVINDRSPFTRDRVDHLIRALPERVTTVVSGSVDPDKLKLRCVMASGQLMKEWEFDVHREVVGFKAYCQHVIVKTFVQMGQAYLSPTVVSWFSTLVVIALGLGIKYPEWTPVISGLVSVIGGVFAGTQASIVPQPTSPSARSAFSVISGNIVGAQIAAGIAVDQMRVSAPVASSATFLVVAAYGGLMQLFELAARNHYALQNARTSVSFRKTCW